MMAVRAHLVSLLTKAVGGITALLIATAKDDRIGAYTGEYLAAINAYDQEAEDPIDMAAREAELVAALRAARQFIRNGIEYGYIRMPDLETPDSAQDTLPMIEVALSRVSSQKAEEA